MISSARVRYKSLMPKSLTLLWSTWQWSLSDSITAGDELPLPPLMNYQPLELASHKLQEVMLLGTYATLHTPSLKCWDILLPKPARGACSGKASFHSPPVIQTGLNQKESKGCLKQNVQQLELWYIFHRCVTTELMRFSFRALWVLLKLPGTTI